METTIKTFVSKLVPGSPQEHANMTVFPIFSGLDEGLEYLALGQALAKQVLTITEVSQGGSVPQLLAVNSGELPVLIVDGEELAGAKQNRILNASVLLAPKSETVIPVSCTEQGRWSYRSNAFFESGTVAPSEVRAHKMRSVHASLEASHSFASDQGEVWAGVHRAMRMAGSESPTFAMRDVYEQRRDDLDGYMKAFPLQRGQRGLLACVNGRIVGMDWLSRTEAYAALHEKLVRSHALGAWMQQEPHTGKVDADAAQRFLDAAGAAKTESYPSVGLGTDVRLAGEGVMGEALVHEAAVLHLAVYRAAEARQDRPHPTMRDTGTLRRRWPA